MRLRLLFRPGYAAHLVEEWLPALDGVVEKLREGASVADVGCGLGASTIIMAEAFARSTFAGFDIHEPSIVAARKAAVEAGVDRRARFDVTTAKELPGTGFDLVCMFDCLHGMGDPVGAARRIRQALAPDGTLLLVEPLAGDWALGSTELAIGKWGTVVTIRSCEATYVDQVGGDMRGLHDQLPCLAE